MQIGNEANGFWKVQRKKTFLSMRIYLLFHPYGLFNIRLHIERMQTFNLFLQPFAGCAKRIMDIHSFQTSSHVWFDRHISAFQGIFFLMHNSPYNIFLLVSNFLISSSFCSFISQQEFKSWIKDIESIGQFRMII